MAGIYDSILTGVKARIDGAGTLPPTVIRKQLAFLEGDTIPSIIIAPLEPEAIAMEYFGRICYSYSVGVALVETGNRQYTAGLTSSLDLRETLRNTLVQLFLPAVPEVWDVDVTPGLPIYFPSDGPATNYQTSTFNVRYKTDEARPGYPALP